MIRSDMNMHRSDRRRHRGKPEASVQTLRVRKYLIQHEALQQQNKASVNHGNHMQVGQCRLIYITAQTDTKLTKSTITVFL